MHARGVPDNCHPRCRKSVLRGSARFARFLFRSVIMTQTSPIRGSRPGPGSPGANLEWAVIKPGQTRNLVLLSPYGFGWWMHWNQNQSHPCRDPHEQCNHCGRCSKRWYAHYLVWPGEKMHPLLLDLPQTAWMRCPELDEPDLDLRGMFLLVERRGYSMSSPLFPRITGEVYDRDLPKHPTIEEALTTKWGFSVQ